MRKRKRKPNAGSFKKGQDPRRHTFTTAERRRGYKLAKQATDGSWELAAWFYYRIRGYYRRLAAGKRK